MVRIEALSMIQIVAIETVAQLPATARRAHEIARKARHNRQI
jgi:hypothetical protein